MLDIDIGPTFANIARATGSDLPNKRKLLESSTEKAGFNGLNRPFQARIDANKQT